MWGSVNPGALANLPKTPEGGFLALLVVLRFLELRTYLR